MTDLPPARVLDVTPDEYHKLPGLSPSLAHKLYQQCGLIARDTYERKLEEAAEQKDGDAEGDVDAEKQKRLDRGSILHALVLGIGKRIEVIPSAKLSKNGAYGTDAAKALRDGARAAGRIPVKEPDMPMHQRTVDAIRVRLMSAGYALGGASELAIEWWEPTEHGPVQCRTMLDHVELVAADGLAVDPGKPPVHIRPTAARVFELKFPGDAAPDRSERTSDGLGYPVAAAARHRALNALYPSIAGRIEYRYLFCEPHRPYAFWDPTPTGAYLEFGLRCWRTAVRAWADGLNSGRWTDYHDDITRRQIDLPRWRKMQEGFTDDEL